MKKQVIALFLLLTLLFTLTSCDISNLKNLFNGNEGSGGEEENGGEENDDGNKINGIVYSEFGSSYYSDIRFNATANKSLFAPDETVEVTCYFGTSISSASYISEYYDIYFVSSGKECIYRHAEEDIFDDKYTHSMPNGKDLFNHSEKISIPTELFDKAEDYVSIRVCAIYGATEEGGWYKDFYTRKTTAGCNIYYEKNDDGIRINKIEVLDYNHICGNSNANHTCNITNFKSEEMIVNSTSPDTAYYSISNEGYNTDEVFFDLYFGRTFAGTVEDYKSKLANSDLGKASIYLECAGERILALKTEDDYISDRYRTKWYGTYAGYEDRVSYKAPERINIPAELISGDRGVINVFVCVKEGAAEEENALVTVPIYYEVKDGRVYLSRRFEPTRDEGLDFWIYDSSSALTDAENIAMAESQPDSFTCFYDKKYDTSAGILENEWVLYEVLWDVVIGIQIYDPQVSLYGLTLNSTPEQFIETFERMGYEIIDMSQYVKGDDQFWVRARYANVVVDFTSNVGRRNNGKCLEIYAEVFMGTEPDIFHGFYRDPEIKQ